MRTQGAMYQHAQPHSLISTVNTLTVCLKSDINMYSDEFKIYIFCLSIQSVELESPIRAFAFDYV